MIKDKAPAVCSSIRKRSQKTLSRIHAAIFWRSVTVSASTSRSGSAFGLSSKDRGFLPGIPGRRGYGRSTLTGPSIFKLAASMDAGAPALRKPALVFFPFNSISRTVACGVSRRLALTVGALVPL